MIEPSCEWVYNGRPSFQKELEEEKRWNFEEGQKKRGGRRILLFKGFFFLIEYFPHHFPKLVKSYGFPEHWNLQIPIEISS
jgi:hypothetical protein